MGRNQNKFRILQKKPKLQPFNFNLLPTDIQVCILILVNDVTILHRFMFRTKFLYAAIRQNTHLTRLLCERYIISKECETDFLLSNLKSKFNSGHVHVFNYCIRDQNTNHQIDSDKLRNMFFNPDSKPDSDSDSNSDEAIFPQSPLNDFSSLYSFQRDRKTLTCQITHQPNKVATIEFYCGADNDAQLGKTKRVGNSNKFSTLAKIHKQCHDCIALNFFEIIGVEKIQNIKNWNNWLANMQITRKNLSTLVKTLRLRKMCLTLELQQSLLDYLVKNGKMTPIAASIMLDLISKL